MNQVVMPPVLAGCIVSCGALLVVAGAGKLYRGARGRGGATAVWRVLRTPRRWWRRADLAAGGLECAVGVLVCSGGHPVLGGAGLAALASVFCALLGYLRVKRIPGGCGCLGWRPAQETAPETITWRAMARSGLVLGAGIAEVSVRPRVAGGFHQAWFTAGILAGGSVLAVLSVRTPVRTPVCRRPLWRGRRATLRALAGHETFAVMAASAGPFGAVARYRRAGCTDEFWFAAAGPGRRPVVFQVSQAVPGGRMAVHASLRDGQTPLTAWPARAVSVPEWPVPGLLGSARPRPRDHDGHRATGGKSDEIPAGA